MLERMLRLLQEEASSHEHAAQSDSGTHLNGEAFDKLPLHMKQYAGPSFNLAKFCLSLEESHSPQEDLSLALNYLIEIGAIRAYKVKGEGIIDLKFSAQALAHLCAGNLYSEKEGMRSLLIKHLTMAFERSQTILERRIEAYHTKLLKEREAKIEADLKTAIRAELSEPFLNAFKERFKERRTQLANTDYEPLLLKLIQERVEKAKQVAASAMAPLPDTSTSPSDTPQPDHSALIKKIESDIKRECEQERDQEISGRVEQVLALVLKYVIPFETTEQSLVGSECPAQKIRKELVAELRKEFDEKLLSLFNERLEAARAKDSQPSAEDPHAIIYRAYDILDPRRSVFPLIP